MVQEDQQQGERGEPLLAVDDELLAVLVADDNRTQEIVAVVGYGASLVRFLMALEELCREVVDQLRDLLLAPLVFALVVIDRVLPACEKLSDRPAFAID